MLSSPPRHTTAYLCEPHGYPFPFFKFNTNLIQKYPLKKRFKSYYKNLLCIFSQAPIPIFTVEWHMGGCHRHFFFLFCALQFDIEAWCGVWYVGGMVIAPAYRIFAILRYQGAVVYGGCGGNPPQPPYQ